MNAENGSKKEVEMLIDAYDEMINDIVIGKKAEDLDREVLEALYRFRIKLVDYYVSPATR